ARRTRQDVSLDVYGCVTTPQVADLHVCPPTCLRTPISCGTQVLRRPLEHLQPAGFQIDRHERFKLGIVERLTARKPTTAQQNTTSA
ncbi:MAG: hypothetical protein ACRDPT_12205, partial [Streptomycetales bacterium]